MPQPNSNDRWEEQIKSALGKQIGDGFQHADPSPALRDKMMFEAGRAAQGRADRKYLAGSLFVGLAGGWLIAFLPATNRPSLPTTPNERPFFAQKDKVETPAPAVTDPSHIWHARVDPKQIEEPPEAIDLGGAQFIHADQPTTVRSLSNVLRELQR